MPITTWIGAIIDIPSKILAWRKSKLEIQRLQDEERERNLIRRPTIEEIKKYDLNYQKLESEIRRRKEMEQERDELQAFGPGNFIILLPLIILIVIVALVYGFCKSLIG